jgi:hypothetical protein
VRAGVVATEPGGVGAIHHGEAQRRVEPAVGVEDALGVQRQSRRQHVPVILGDGAQHVEVGPRPLGVDVVGRHR